MRACDARGCTRVGWLRRPNPLDPAYSVVVCEVHAAQLDGAAQRTRHPSRWAIQVARLPLRRCRVPECGRLDRVISRGRCRRCARRAQRGGWSHEDPALDAVRWRVWLAAHPAARLAALGDSDAARELARRRSTRSPR